jgi:hypothetical protein
MDARILVSGIAISLVLSVAAARADDNVRQVQTKLRDGGFYYGEIDGAYSSDLAAALSRYQIRNGLAITGQLDIDTAKSLGAKPAVTTTGGDDPARSSETWQRLRKSDQQYLAKLKDRPTPAPAMTPMSNEPTIASPPPSARSNATLNLNTERLRDYVGAFVLAGLDPQVGAEAAFFADRVRYFDEGFKDRETIRQDLKRYDAHWPERKFWLAGDITVEPENDERVRVTFPLRYELRNGAQHLAGKVNKTIVLQPGGDDLQIVAVNEKKAE